MIDFPNPMGDFEEWAKLEEALKPFGLRAVRYLRTEPDPDRGDCYVKISHKSVELEPVA